MSPDSYLYDFSDAGSYDFRGWNYFSSTVPDTKRYYLDDSRLVSPYGHSIPLVVADLLDVAAAAMYADRHSLRPRNYGPFRQSRGWMRHFEITLGVRMPDIWNSPPVKEQLESLLGWLTEDTWQIRFVYQPVHRLSDVRPALFSSPPANALVALYSGGLDSLAGVVHLLRTHPQESVILVSAVSDRLSGVVRGQVAELQRHFPERVQCAYLPFHLIHGTQHREEQSQRTRGFLFFSFGAAQAMVYNASRVVSCENGVGMLNLPLNKRQLGTQHSRAMHPRTIVGMTKLLSLIGLSSVRCEAPYLALTKAELCKGLKESGLGSLCATTISCDSFPLRIPTNSSSSEQEWHCGLCTSCLLRRQAIFAAYLEEYNVDSMYRCDVCSSTQPISMNLEPLKMMLDQVALINNACNTFQPEINLYITFPELLTARLAVEQAPDAFGLPQRISVTQVLVRLLRQYAEEWNVFPYQLEARRERIYNER